MARSFWLLPRTGGGQQLAVGWLMPEAVPGPAAKAPPVEPSPSARIARREADRSRESIWWLRKALPKSYRLPFALAMPGLVMVLWCALTLGSKPIVSELFLPSPVAVLRETLNLIFE